MSTVEQEVVPALVAGDFLSRTEFLHRWEAMPDLKRAELIRGVVYMPSPLSLEHGDTEFDLAGWLAVYKLATPGCQGANNTTWLMGRSSAPQPDVSLRILPEYGGQSRKKGRYASGAPEFLTEVCVSSTAYDLHQKLEVYEEAGVKEYLAVLVREQEVRWHRLVRRRFKVVAAPADGVYCSAVFPGLWLDSVALLANDTPRVMAVLQEGINTPEHAEFVQRLAARHKGG